MITLLAALAFGIPLSGATQVPQQVNELRALARDGPDSALVERVRRGSDDAREALPGLLAEVARGTSDSAQASALAAANRLAAAVAVAWRDSFLVRQVARFRSLSATEQQATIEADSLRLAGEAAIGVKGIDVVMRNLRQALPRFEALADTSKIAATLSGLGRGFHSVQEYDSAVAYFTRAGTYAERIGDLQTWAIILGNLGSTRRRQGDLQGASESLARALQLFERIGDGRGLRVTQNGLGLVAWSRGDLAGARGAFEAGLASSRSANDAKGTAKFLSNLGALTAEAGDYATATVLMQEGSSIYRELEQWLTLAMTLRNLGDVMRRRGDYRAAIKTFSEAAGIMRRLGPDAVINEIDEVDVRSDMARARAGMGDLQGARAELDGAESLVSRLGSRRRESVVELAVTRGELELKFNRLGEAERQFLRAQRLAHGEMAERRLSQAQIGLASVLLTRGSYRRAQIALEQVLSRRHLGAHATAKVRLLLGQAAWRRGDTASAGQAFRRALDTLRAAGAVPDEAQALVQLGDLEAGAGRTVAAESLYQRGLTRLRARPTPAVAWQLHGGLAAIRRRRGALADAARELQAGIGEIERVSGSLELEENRSAFQADKWDMYVDLALVEYARGRTEAALEASERLRGRQMLDLLARGRVSEREPLRDLSVREQDLRRRIGELAPQTEGPRPGEAAGVQVLRDPASSEKASNLAAEELERLQQDYAKLLLEMREADPSYTALVRGETARAREVMGALAPDEALLEYLVGDSTTLVFIVTRDTLAALDLQLSHDALAAQVDFARSTVASATEGAARRAWRPPLRRLYQQLVAPVEASGLLEGKRRVLIAPHAELHYLPFSALVRPGPPEQPLIERYLIEYVSSASVWMGLRRRPEPKLGGGILALAPRAKALPGSRAEVAAIRRIYGDRAQTLVGTPATEHTFRTLAPGREIIHLATFGVLNKHNPLFSYVEMGAGDGEDGRLEVHEVFGLTLNARLLVLSACQTGLAAGTLADVPPGDDWVGLVQGFLYAGASNVVATLWPVADVATARLMERFYGELAAGRSEAEALALAQRAVARDPATAHPFFWAGFALVRGR